jgi:hypothetical protein
MKGFKTQTMQVRLRERRMEKRVLAKLLVTDPYHGNTEQTLEKN